MAQWKKITFKSKGQKLQETCISSAFRPTFLYLMELLDLSVARIQN